MSGMNTYGNSPCVRAGVRACMRACVYSVYPLCVCVCVCICVCMLIVPSEEMAYFDRPINREGEILYSVIILTG